MSFRFASITLLLMATSVSAQVASHAPTNFPSVPAPIPTDINRPVVRVNGSILTNADLTREEYAIFPYARQHGGLPKDLEPQIRDGAMKMIIFEELVYQEAVRRKMTIPAAKLQKAESDFRKQFANPNEFNALMQSEFHSSPQLLEEKIRRSLLIDTLLKSEVEARSSVTPAEIRAFYDKNPARFTHPETYAFQTISVLPPAHATAEQLKEGRTRAEKALVQAKATKNVEEFGLLAEKISDDDYRVMMGEHKPVAANQLAPQVLQAFVSMHPGDVSNLIQLDQAYTIVRLEAHTPAGKAKFEEVRPALEKELQQSKKNQLRSALDHKLQQNAKIEVM
jgi:peptidyl-prolyl cis-trans isomerase SurA